MEWARLVGGPFNGCEIAAEALGGRFPVGITVPVANSFALYDLDTSEGVSRYFFRGWQQPPPRNQLRELMDHHGDLSSN